MTSWSTLTLMTASPAHMFLIARTSDQVGSNPCLLWHIVSGFKYLQVSCFLNSLSYSKRKQTKLHKVQCLNHFIFNFGFVNLNSIVIVLGFCGRCRGCPPGLHWRFAWRGCHPDREWLRPKDLHPWCLCTPCQGACQCWIRTCGPK